MSRTRAGGASAAVLLALAAARPARAQTDPDGTEDTAARSPISVTFSAEDAGVLTHEQAARWFGAARCACNASLEAAISLDLVRGATDQASVTAVVGYQCSHGQTCLGLGSWTLGDVQSRGTVRVAFSALDHLLPQARAAFALDAGTAAGGPAGCEGVQEDLEFCVRVQETQDGTEIDDSLCLPIRLDAVPPAAPRPALTEPEGGESSVRLSWQASPSGDIDHYRVLCWRNQQAVFVDRQSGRPALSRSWTPYGSLAPPDDPDGCADPDYVPDCRACERRVRSDLDPACAAADAGGDGGHDGGADAGGSPQTGGPPRFADECFLCGAENATGTDARIDGLANDASYRFFVLPVDRAGNAGPMADLGEAAPAATEDFAERLARRGGAAEGGMCALGGGGAAGALGGGRSAGAGAAAWIAAAAALAARGRRRARTRP